MQAVEDCDAAEELRRRQQARESLLAFTEYTHPSWETGEHHRKICYWLEQVEQGKVRRLAIDAPPRHSKSELASRRFPAWYLGRHPDRQIICASAAGLLASDIGADVRDIIRDPEFRLVFPRVEVSQDAAAAGRWRTKQGGIYYAAGVGGTIVGRGGNLCIAEGEPVLTRRGWAPIEDIRPGDEVLTHRFRWRRVVAALENGARPVISLSGRGANLVCTPDHRIWTGSEWVEAHNAKQAVVLDMQAVQQGIHAAMAAAQGESAAFLFSGVLAEVHIRAIVGQETKMPEVRSAGHAPSKLRQAALLLDGVLLDIKARVGIAAQAARRPLRSLWQVVSSALLPPGILRHGMQECGAFCGDGGRWQPQSQARTAQWHPHETLSQHVEGDASARSVFRVRGADESCGAPHQRGQDGQFDVQPGANLPELPHALPQLDGPVIARVFDLQVEEDSSFCVGGFFAHNCVVDDPHGGREEADSERKRQVVTEWFHGDLVPRLMTPQAIVLIMTRWHEADLAGHLLPPETTWQPIGNGAYRAMDWVVLRLRAIDGEEQGKPVPLWPGVKGDRFPLDRLYEIRESLRQAGRLREWYAQYQQRPVAEEGSFIKREWFAERWTDETLPENRTPYLVNDFAVTEKTSGNDPDRTELGAVAIGEDDRVYILDWWSGLTTSDVWIEQLLDMVLAHRPRCCFGEKGVIKNAIEPLLIRRMRERRAHCRLEWMPTMSDKLARGRGFQAWAASGRVIFPAKAPWVDAMIEELVAVGGGGRYWDKFDALSHFFLAIDKAHPAIGPKPIAEAERGDPYETISDGRRQRWKVV